jgi:hypothetical protein
MSDAYVRVAEILNACNGQRLFEIIIIIIIIIIKSSTNKNFSTNKKKMSSSTHTFQLTDNVGLRVRQPSVNTSGSMLLLTPDGVVWDCVECKEWNEVRYTEEDWLQRYIIINGVRDEDEAKQISDENADEMHFTFKNLRKPNVLAKLSANNCKLSITKDPINRFGIVSSTFKQDDGSLELFFSEDIERSKSTIQSIEYTSLLLMFEPMVFDEPTIAANKRARIE